MSETEEAAEAKGCPPPEGIYNKNNLRQQVGPGFIANLLAHLVYSLASMITDKHFKALARRRAVSTQELPLHALRVSIGVPQRLAVVCRGGLSVLLVQMLICFGRERAVKRALKHVTSMMSRRHFVGLKDRIPKCVST